MLLALRSLWERVVQPTPVPIPIETARGAPGRGRKLDEEEALYRRRLAHRFDVQNRDDLEVVHVLTDFLSRV